MQGSYFNEGRNYKIQELIEKLYTTSKEMKRQGNPIEKIIKLFMNSLYGKSTIKTIDTDIKVLKQTRSL